MTEIKTPHPVIENISLIEKQQVSARGGVLSVLGGISEPTLKVLRMLGIVPDPRHPDVILEELNAKRRTEVLLDAHNDNISESNLEQEAA